MRVRFTNSCRRAVALVAAVAGALLAHAEGSKNLTPGTGTRGTATGTNNYIGYLQHNDGPVDAANSNSRYFLKENSPENQRLYIRVKVGETLYYGVRRVRTNEATGGNVGRLRLQLKYASITNPQVVVNTSILEPLNPAPAAQEQPNLAPGAGVIATPEQAAAGPNYTGGPTTGYNPLSYTNTTGADQNFWVEFMEVTANGTVAATQNKAWYDLWDFTVRDATGEKPGRLYSQHWSFTAAAGPNALSSSFALYPLIPNPNFVDSYFVKRVSYAGIQPFGVILVANSAGTTAPGNFKDKRKSQTTNLGYAEYKLFVNDPDPAIYLTSPRPTNPTVTTACSGGVTTFTLTVDQAGFGVVFIDGDADGLYDRTKDRVLEKPTVIGNNTFTWDGKTDSGVAMSQTTLSVTFSSGVGPVNFPIWDCEQAPTTGISVQDVRPGTQGAADFIFWNDSLLLPGFSTPLINPIGSNTPATSHRWSSNAGNEKLVNSYAVGLLARGNAVQINYNPATACATTPPVVLEPPLPVELVRFVAARQAGQVRLNWETASEKSSSYFDIQRSTDGRVFENLGRVAAAGTTSQRRSYSFLDTEPPAATTYYRLHQVDTDGQNSYSPVEVVAGARTGSLTLYPNPAGPRLTLLLPAAASGPLTLRVLDATGRVVYQEQRSLETSTTRFHLDTTPLPAGNWYLLQVQTATSVLTQRFQK